MDTLSDLIRDGWHTGWGMVSVAPSRIEESHSFRIADYSASDLVIVVKV